MNKYVLLFAVFCVCNVFNASAKRYSDDQLPVVVRNLQEWSWEYPTVVNNWNGLFVTNVTGELPQMMSVITSINGKSTKGMSAESFNDLLMQNGQAILEYSQKEKGSDVKRTCTIQYPISFYWAEGMNMTYPEALPDYIKLANDKSVEFSKYNTFSFDESKSNLGIDMKRLIEAVTKVFTHKGLALVENNGDITMSFKKSKDQYNGTCITLNLFDAKSNQNKSVWSMTINDLSENLTNDLTSVIRNISTYCINYPFETPVFCKSVETLGIAFESKESVGTGRVVNVLKGTDAYEKGLRGGDVITKAYHGASYNGSWYNSRKYWFKNTKRDQAKNWGIDFLYGIIPIWPHYKKNESEHYLVMSYVGGSNFSKNHFQVKKQAGSKVKMNAPFSSHTYSFSYIR